MRLEQRPLVLAVGAADDVRLKVVATHGLADGILAVPCADGILLRRIWQLVDRELEQRWARLPPLQRTVVGSTRGLLHAAGTAVRDGGELASEAARVAGRQIVETLAAQMLGNVLTSLQAHHDYTFAHSFRVAAHLATFAVRHGHAARRCRAAGAGRAAARYRQDGDPGGDPRQAGAAGQQRMAGGAAPPGGGGRGAAAHADACRRI